jgi:hypothetical protein
MPRSFYRLPISTLLLLFFEAGGDPTVFCYRMGVGIFSTSRARFITPALSVAGLDAEQPLARRNQVACFNLFSIFSSRFSILKD